MKWLLLTTLGLIGVTIVALCLLVLLVRHRLRLRHRVDPKVATGAPMTWLADPRAPARLHRRLARVGRTARTIAEDHRVARPLRRAVEQPPLVGVAEELREHAVRLDRELARAVHLPAEARRGALRRIAEAVVELEATAARLSSISTEVLTPPVLPTEEGDITEVAGQVRRLAEAHAALVAIDAEVGLAPTPAVGQR